MNQVGTMTVSNAMLLVLVALLVGFAIGRYSAPNMYEQAMQAQYDSLQAMHNGR